VRVVIDTNVLRAGIRSPTAASREILSLVDEEIVIPVVSVPLVFEYESVLKRDEFLEDVGFSARDVDAILDNVVARAHLQRIDFLWRPFLPDAKDDCVLECAVNGMAAAILTFNKRDFPLVRARFGVAVLRPREFLAAAGGD
jgi:putative PIN family toxin of toxin-antitoxin system